MPNSRQEISMHRSRHARLITSGAAALSLVTVVPLHPATAQRSAIPTPESVFGFAVGADYKLFGYDQSIAYFKRLAATSNRIKLIEVGKTSSGHAWTAAIISSPQNLAKIDQYRRINMR